MGDGESRVERETGIDRGTRLVEFDRVARERRVTLCLKRKPPAQPHRRVSIERPIRLADGGGYFGDEAPQDDAGYIEFARSLQKPDIYDVIKVAEPLSAPTPYHFKANVRRHYERLPSFPEGFLVFGDAICSFNPVYGQGMTVACLEAQALSQVLTAGRQSLAQRFFQAAAHIIDIPWQIALGSDFQNPRVEGKRTAPTRFINWYVGKLYRAAEHDAVLARAFLEVANLTNPPSALLRPAIIRRVWAGGAAHPSQTRAAAAA